jgi:hypothetical protein
LKKLFFAYLKQDFLFEQAYSYTLQFLFEVPFYHGCTYHRVLFQQSFSLAKVYQDSLSSFTQ